jgi:hypothetical protein
VSTPWGASAPWERQCLGERQLNSYFNLYNDVYLEKNDFKGQMGKIGILRNFPAKMDFSCFLVLKTGKLSNFTLDKYFVPSSSVKIHLFSLTVPG